MTKRKVETPAELASLPIQQTHAAASMSAMPRTGSASMPTAATRPCVSSPRTRPACGNC